MYCWKQVSKIRHKTYKLLKYLLGADKMAQFGEFNAQNPCEKQLSVMHTYILALGKWRHVEPWTCFSIVYVESSKPVKDPCWIKVGAPESNQVHSLSSTHMHTCMCTCTHANKQIHTCTKSKMNYNKMFHCKSIKIPFIVKALAETNCCWELLHFLMIAR